jgi:hypothetical protein
MSKFGIRVMMTSNLQFLQCMGPKKILFSPVSKLPPLNSTHERIYLLSLKRVPKLRFTLELRMFDGIRS